MSTAKIAAQIAEFERTNPKARGIPKELKNAYQKAFLAEAEGKRTPITWKGREAYLESHGTRTTRPGADKWKVVYSDQRAKKGRTRRAGERRQSLTIEDYRDFAKRNGYSLAEADRLYKVNETKLSGVQRGRNILSKARNFQKLIYEHLSPQVSKKYGGVEHYRNIVLMDDKTNTAKSDKMPRAKTLQKLGIPLSKQSALQKDFAGEKVTPAKVRRAEVLKDISKPGTESARTVNARIEGKRASLGSTGSGVSTKPNSSLTMGNKPSLSNVIKTMHGGRAIMHHSPLGMPIYVP